MASADRVNALLAALHAHRVATFRPEDLAVNVNQRQFLVDHADREKSIRKGDVVTPFTLPEVGGGHVVLDELLAQGPVVLVFFRFAGCPACNIALPYYQRALYPDLRKLGATLVAISPQVPERLVDIKTRHELDFLVASDIDNVLGKRFGIVFTADEASQAAARAKGTDLGQVTGTGTWELPMPAAIVIGQDRIVQFAAVSPDWLVRSEADEILGELRRVVAISKAA